MTIVSTDAPPRHSRKMYLNFLEGMPRMEPGRSAPYSDRLYVPLRCPHCEETFIKVPLDQLSASKASKCITHLRRCPDFSGHVAPVKVLVPQKQVYGDNVSRMIGRSIERDHSPLSPARVRHPNEHPSTSQGQPLDSHWPVCLTRTPACRSW